MKTIALRFAHCADVDLVPDYAGIYVVYGRAHGQPRRLVYIGQAERMRSRILQHELYYTWLSACDTPPDLSYAYALLLPPQDRLRAEEALIYRCKPLVTADAVTCFTFGPTEIQLEGTAPLLQEAFASQTETKYSNLTMRYLRQ